MDEVEAVAQAIEDQLTAEDDWMVGTPALFCMCHDFAQAAIAALDAARGDPVARLIAHMKTIEPDEETAGCPATWADFIQILEGIAEAGEPFNDRAMADPTDAELDRLVEQLGAIIPLLDGLETGQDCADYAFAKSNGFQAMTYCPDAFEALRSVPEAAAAITALRARIEMLEAAAIPPKPTQTN